MRCICTTLLNGLNHPHPNFPQRFFYLHRLALSCETVGQQAFVAWLGEDVGVEYDVVVPFCMTCRAGDAAGVAFAVQACAEDLRGAVITRVDEFGMLRQCRTQVEQRGVAMHTVDFALGEDGFARIAPARVGEQAVDPVVYGFVHGGGDAVAAVPHAKATIGKTRLLPVGASKGVADGVVPVGGFKRTMNRGGGGLVQRWFDFGFDRLRQRPVIGRVGKVVK